MIPASSNSPGIEVKTAQKRKILIGIANAELVGGIAEAITFSTTFGLTFW